MMCLFLACRDMVITIRQFVIGVLPRYDFSHQVRIYTDMPRYGSHHQAGRETRYAAIWFRASGFEQYIYIYMRWHGYSMLNPCRKSDHDLFINLDDKIMCYMVFVVFNSTILIMNSMYDMLFPGMPRCGHNHQAIRELSYTKSGTHLYRYAALWLSP